MHTRIEGFGGGGKGGGGVSSRAPVEDPNSLVSHQFANVIDLISEGPIEGLINGLKGVYLNGVPIQNPDSSYNFQGVTINTTLGTQSQGVLPAANWAGSETSVNTEVVYSTPITRHIDASGQTRLRVTVAVPVLSVQDTSTGDLHGNSVRIQVDVNNNGGGYVNYIDDTITGKCVSKYQRAYMINLPAGGPWDVKVTRVSAADSSSAYQSRTWWSSYTEIIDDQFNYPNSALVELEVDSQYFSSIPARGFHIKGLQTKIPSNYNPVTRVYTGTWDGTFSVAWTNNPAWCFYDLLTSTRYGLGKYIDATQVDKWALYTVAQYCDVLVDNGFGGTEPRFTCNLYLQTQADAYNVLANVASIFRAMIYWASGQVIAVQDCAVNPTGIYTRANVVDGHFSYQGSSLKTRHTVALVTWNDPADQYNQKVEYVPLRSAIKQYGVVETSITAFGCTSRGQAHRLGLWLLYNEQINTETITFRVGLDNIFCSPGSIIHTNDPSRQSVRFGGRCVTATTAAVTLDKAVTLLGGKTYTLSCVLPTGAVETRDVTNSAGEASTLTVGTAFSAAPQAYSLWSLSQNDLIAEAWRVISMPEVDKGIVEIVALAHNAALFDAVDTGVTLSVIPDSPRLQSSTPTNIVFTESIYPAGLGTVGIALHMSWQGNSPRYEVQYREPNGNWVYILSTTHSNVDITGLVTALQYEFVIVAVDTTGTRLPSANTLYTVIGLNSSPPQVTGLVITGDGQGPDTGIKWDETIRTDYYSIEVRTAGILRRTVSTTDLAYTYTDDNQREDGSHSRAVNFRVWSANNSGRCTAYSEVTGGNTAPARLTGVNAIGIEKSFVIYYTPPPERDWAGCLVHLGTSSPVTPSAGNQVYDGKDGSIVISKDAAGNSLVLETTYYFQIAAYDTYGKVIADLNYLASSGSITLIGSTGGIEVVSSLPVTPSASQEVVLLSTDHKLYRWDGSAYIRTTDGADLVANSVTAGKISVASLAAINANLGTITAGNMTVDSSGYIKGGQTAFDTGTGFWLGYSTTYKFSVGNASGDKLTFDGSSFLVSAGQTGFNTGTGFWLGKVSSAYKMSIGNPAGDHLNWDGTNLSINSPQFTLSAGSAAFSGALSAATGTFAGALSSATGTFAGALSAATGTFSGALSGATGTFSGALSAASGTFSGALSAATGTFSGTLTADNVVETHHISDGAVTNTIYAYTDAELYLYGAGLDIQSATITSTGKPILIHFSCVKSGGSIQIELLRGTTQIIVLPSNNRYLPNADTMSLDFIDTPAAGTYTYKIRTTYVVGNIYVPNRFMSLLEIKK